MVKVECHRADIKRALQLDDDELERQMKRHCAHENADAEIAAAMDASDFDVMWATLDEKDVCCDFCQNLARYCAMEDHDVVACETCAKKESPTSSTRARGQRIIGILECECGEVDETPAQETERARNRLEWRYFSIDVGLCDHQHCDLGARYHLRGGGPQYCPEHFPLKTR
jgi:hypothetical protein